MLDEENKKAVMKPDDIHEGNYLYFKLKLFYSDFVYQLRWK